MSNEFKDSFKIIISGLIGAILGAWTTTLFQAFSWNGFLWILGGCVVIYITIALVLKLLNRK